MSTCLGCGGRVGVDCFNPQECQWIAQDQRSALCPGDALVAATAERDRFRDALTLIASPNRATYDKGGTGAWKIATDALAGRREFDV